MVRTPVIPARGTPHSAHSTAESDTHGTQQRTGPRSLGVDSVSAARIPGLILPVAFFCAFVAAGFWYWRHRGD